MMIHNRAVWHCEYLTMITSHFSWSSSLLFLSHSIRKTTFFISSFHLKWTLIEMCNGIKTKIAQSFKQSMYCEYLYLLWLHAVVNIIIKISAIALFTCTTLLFNSHSLSVSLLCAVCYSSTTFHCHLLLFHFSKRYRAYVTQCVDFCGLSRGVFHFFIPLLLLVLFILFFRNAVIQYTAITHSLSLLHSSLVDW